MVTIPCDLAVVEELPIFLNPPFWNHYQPPFPAHNSRQLTKTGRVSQTPKLRSKDPKAVRPQVTQLTDSTVCRGSKRPSTQKVAVTLSVYKLLKMRCPKKNPMVNDLKWFISRIFRMLKHFEKRHFCHFSRAAELQTILLISAGFIECRPVKKGMERDSPPCLHFWVFYLNFCDLCFWLQKKSTSVFNIFDTQNTFTIDWRLSRVVDIHRKATEFHSWSYRIIEVTMGDVSGGFSWEVSCLYDLLLRISYIRFPWDLCRWLTALTLYLDHP